MQLRTKQQQEYFQEVIRLRYEHGYSARRISRILPIGHATVSRWFSIFASQNGEKYIPMAKSKSKSKSKLKLQSHPAPVESHVDEVTTFRSELTRLQAQLQEERLRADAYEEMINVAETQLKISIRKKVGAKR
jgi:transposase